MTMNDDDDDDDHDHDHDHDHDGSGGDDGHTLLVIISSVLFPVYEKSEADRTSIPLRRRSKWFHVLQPDDGTGAVHITIFHI